jgi:hypothetical protein
MSEVIDTYYLQQLKLDYEAELNSISDNMTKMKAAHEEAIIALETNFNVKLTVEYDKYQALETNAKKISKDYERYACITSLYSISCQKDN